jgi:hypothetical protein
MTTQSRPATTTPQAIYTHHQTLSSTSNGLLERLAACDSLRRQLKAFELVLVEDARSEGATWEDIGAMLGVTKQAAAQRFTG